MGRASLGFGGRIFASEFFECENWFVVDRKVFVRLPGCLVFLVSFPLNEVLKRSFALVPSHLDDFFDEVSWFAGVVLWFWRCGGRVFVGCPVRFELANMEDIVHLPTVRNPDTIGLSTDGFNDLVRANFPVRKFGGRAIHGGTRVQKHNFVTRFK